MRGFAFTTQVYSAWLSVLSMINATRSTARTHWNSETSDEMLQRLPSLYTPNALPFSEPHTEAETAGKKHPQNMLRYLYLDDSNTTIPFDQLKRLLVTRYVAYDELCDPVYWTAVDPVSSWKAAYMQAEHDILPLEFGLLNEMYTHLATNCVLFGMITSWRYTWILRLVPDQMDSWPWTGKLYVSPAIPDYAQHTTLQPMVTAIGAVTWLGGQAIELGRVLPRPNHTTLAKLQSGGSAGFSRAQDNTQRRLGSPSSPGKVSTSLEGSPSCSVTADVLGAGKSEDCAACATKAATSDAHSRTQLQPAELAISLTGATGDTQPELMEHPLEASFATSGQLEVGKRIRSYDLSDEVYVYSIVHLGTCNGQEAHIKLHGPSEGGMDFFYLEWDVLRALAEANAQSAPKLLGVGHLYLGVHFIATEQLQGQLFSELKRITKEVANAALFALAEVHAVHPNLLQGHIVLENMMFVQCPIQTAVDVHGITGNSHAADSGNISTALVCKFIDFGFARVDGSPRCHQEEVRSLQRLLERLSRNKQ